MQANAEIPARLIPGMTNSSTKNSITAAIMRTAIISMSITLYYFDFVFSDSLKELEYNLNKIEGIIQGAGMQGRRTTFRQEQIYKTTLPIMYNDKDLKLAAKRNILTDGIISTYPFISSSIFDEKGIYIGRNMHNNSMIFIDRYNTQKYKNPNMCVFGMSGAGKSYYTKLLILRY